MMRKSIVFILILMLSFLQGWTPGTMMTSGDGITQILYSELIRSAQAETKQSGTKGSLKPTPKKEGVTAKKKEPAAPKPVAEKPDDFSFEVKEYPDALIGRKYNFVPAPVNAAPPFKVTIASGTLPTGINLNPQTGGVEGEPTAVGVYNVALRVVDAKGKKGTIAGVVRVWRSLTVGEHGQFKGFDGLQMALNMAKDMDEIRIEKGVIGASGLVIPENKAWEHGIKISGGWNETFTEKNEAKKSEVEETGRDYTSENYTVDDPEATILDGEGKDHRILTISNSQGKVTIENLTFRNSKGGAIQGEDARVSFNDCVFEDNSAGEGGAVFLKGEGEFNKCILVRNDAKGLYGPGRGGAVLIRGRGTFNDCIFENNSGEGSAVYVNTGSSSFTNCTFSRNNKTAVYIYELGYGEFNNCTFKNNDYGVKDEGKPAAVFNHCLFEHNKVAVQGGRLFTNCVFKGNDHGAVGLTKGTYGTFVNCNFTENTDFTGGGGAVGGDGKFINCIFGNNGAEYGGAVSVVNNAFFINCTFFNNHAKDHGGAISGGGTVVNSIFYKNTAGEKDNDITVSGNLEIDYSLISYIKGAANFGEHNIMGDPKFVDPDNGDLHLRHDSPAINAGKIAQELRNITTDLDGKPRAYGGKIDMGAYEWQGETIIESKPPLPTSISIEATTGIAIDATTGLQWAQDAGGQKMTWDEANAYVRKLKIGGYSDWRLPTKEELESLLSYCKGISDKKRGCAEYYNKVGFKNVQSINYWSSTSYAYNPGNVWIVNMWNGSVVINYKSNSSVYVWPVRSGQ